MANSISVIVADDHSIYRSGILQSLALDDNIQVVGEAASADSAIELVQRLKPHVALLDISMPGGGIEAAEKIGLISPATRIAILTVSENDDDVMKAVEAGVAGYLLKGIEAMQLVEAVKIVSAGGTYISPELGMRIVSSMRAVRSSPKAAALPSLSEQEERVLRLLGRGKSNRDIANSLNVQESTVKFHVSRILSKLELKSRVDAALVARDLWGAE